LRHLENKVLTLPPLSGPGERWACGASIDWAGKMIEAVGGRSLGALLKKNLLGPLSMDDSAFKISPAMRQHLAAIHLRGPDCELAPCASEIPQEPELEMSGGRLYGAAGAYRSSCA
jgi:methyl acetate hydrolase